VAGVCAGLDTVVTGTDDVYALLRTLAAPRLGTTPDAVRLGRAACPACGGPHGRPVLLDAPDVHVSVATAAGVGAAAVSVDGPVGIDVEAFAGTAFPGFPDVALHPRERSGPAAASAAGRARTWVRKEAVLKAAGVGLLVEPSCVVVSAPDAPPVLEEWPRHPPRVTVAAYLPLPDPAAVHLHDLGAPVGYAAAVAVVSPSPGPAVSAASATSATR
jgi:4'-phosphopantetheinyl transferase